MALERSLKILIVHRFYPLSCGAMITTREQSGSWTRIATESGLLCMPMKS
jgi:hypothetical protein